MFFAKQYALAVEYRRNWFQEKYPYSMCPRGVVNYTKKGTIAQRQSLQTVEKGAL